MDNNFDPLLVKNKFSSLIARLHDIGFTDDLISKTIVEHPFFDLFENNKCLYFLRTPLEQIVNGVFNKKDVFIDYDKPIVSEYLWAGNMYFSLMNEFHIPLERLFLIWPLDVMVNKFTPYHEMPTNSLFDNYLKEEKKIGILRALKNKSGISNRQLAKLTNISESTIASYYDNEKLFKASYQNICLLANVFEAKISIFKKKSSFVMVSTYLFTEENFVQKFKQELIKYFDTDENIYFVRTYKDNDELLQMGKKYKTFIYLPDFALIKYYHERLEYKFLKDNQINMLVMNTLTKEE